MNNKQSANINPATFVKTNTVVHLALVMGQIMFAAVTFSISKNDVHQQDNAPYIYITTFLTITGFAFGHFLFRKSLANIKNEDSLKTKLSIYQSATIKRFALLEGPSLFAIASFLVTHNMLFLGLSAAIIIYFIYLRPTKQKIADDLNLGYDEQAELI